GERQSPVAPPATGRAAPAPGRPAQRNTRAAGAVVPPERACRAVASHRVPQCRSPASPSIAPSFVGSVGQRAKSMRAGVRPPIHGSAPSRGGALAGGTLRRRTVLCEGYGWGGALRRLPSSRRVRAPSVVLLGGSWTPGRIQNAQTRHGTYPARGRITSMRVPHRGGRSPIFSRGGPA